MSDNKTSRPRRVLVTSVVRHADPDQISGFLHLVDLEEGCVQRKCEAPESRRRALDPNPRGGLRGLRGISFHGDRAVLANPERLLLYDRRWRPQGEISHPLMGGVHDVLATERGVWAVSTSADLLLKLSWDSRILDIWEWRQDKSLLSAFGFWRLPAVDRTRDYRDPEAMRSGVPSLAHMNSLSRGPRGGLLVSLGQMHSPQHYWRYRWNGLLGGIARRLGLRRRRRPRSLTVRKLHGTSSGIVCLVPNGSAELLCRVRGISVPNHDIHMEGDVLVYNDSNGSRLVGHSLVGGEELAVAIPGDPGFVRGLAHLGGLVFLVGNQSPLALYEVDLAAGRLVGQIPLDGVEYESTYGICPLPDHFDDPPPRLPPPEG